MGRALVAAIALLPALAGAQDLGPDGVFARRPYAFARIGAVFPRSADLDALGFDAGSALEAGAGIPVFRHVSIEASAGWLAFQLRGHRRIRDSTDPGAPIDESTTTKRLDALPLLATVRVSTRLGPVEVHGAGGAGAYVVWYRLTLDSSLSGRSSYPARDTTFGVHAGAGLAAALSPRTTLGADVRYVSAKATFRFESGSTSAVPPWPVRLDGFVVAATLARLF